MSLSTNDNFQRLLAHLAQMGSAAQRTASGEPLYQQFIQRFPATALRTLTLDEYCVGKGDGASFCRWLERGLQPVLGRYMPGTSRGHLLYFFKDGTVYKNRRLKDLSDQDALAYTLKIQATVAEANPAQDLRWVDDDALLYQRAGVDARVTMGHGRKLRLLSAYHPDVVLPISSTDHLGHFLVALGCPPADVPAKRRPVARMLLLRDYFGLAQQTCPGITPTGFMQALYSPALGLAPVKEDEEDSPDDADLDDTEPTSPTEAMPPLNQILFGPPGTGKTYNTVNAALEVLDPVFALEHKDNRPLLTQRFRELLEAQRIRFVTFHQSFSYEDFVEGLRAETDATTGQIRYVVTDGVFKTLCDAAAAKETKRAEVVIDLAGRRIWKMSLGNTLGTDASIYDECLDGGFALLGYGGAIDFKGCQSRAEVLAKFEEAGQKIADPQNDYAVTAVTTLVTRMKVGDLLVITDGNFKFRAIGEISGDYQFRQHPTYEDDYSQCRPVRWLRQYQPSLPYTELMNNQFSQMTLYELRPGSIDLAKLSALLGAAAKASKPFAPGQSFGSGYEVVRVTDEILELKKPNGNLLPFALSMLNVLATAVRESRITVADIRDKSAIDKLGDSGLEPYLVNGYVNVIPQLVEQMVGGKGGSDMPASAERLGNARVLIIDEINRGNVSRVFGELITLLEPSKRAGGDEPLEVTLPYSHRPFSVPSNVYLIGTMNTADRSLAGLDVALRRRFVFKEMPPRPSLLNGLVVEGLNVELLLTVLNQRIEALLDREHCLGHAYFMPLKQMPTVAKLAEIFRQQVLPLLQEYFFEDWQRIQWVLNDHRKPAAAYQFIRAQPLATQQLFGEGVNVSHRSQTWAINEGAFGLVQSYLGVVDHNEAA